MRRSIEELRKEYEPMVKELMEVCHFSDFLDNFNQNTYYDWCDEYGSDAADQYGYTSTCGETKAVFWNEDDCEYVIKFPFIAYENFDYCKAEVRNYREACKAGLAKRFAWCDKLMDYNGFPIYIMEFCDCDDYGFQDEITDMYISHEKSYRAEHPDDEYEEDPEDMCYDTSTDDAVWDFLEDVYPSDEINALAAFCVSNYISDVHSGNIGRKNGEIVIVDYSGFGSIARADLPDTWWDSLKEDNRE